MVTASTVAETSHLTAASRHVRNLDKLPAQTRPSTASVNRVSSLPSKFFLHIGMREIIISDLSPAGTKIDKVPHQALEIVFSFLRTVCVHLLQERFK